jgi:SAM-dependent methyltransferase
MPDAAQLAQSHWNETPLFLTEEQRYSTYPWLYDAAEFRKHEGEKVLEIGCGTGADLLQFAKHGAIATGVDLTARHVDLARKRVGGLAIVHQADMRHLPFEDESFDYVYSHGVLHHSDEPENVVREMFRVLRPGGLFNVHVYAFWSYITLRGVLWLDAAFVLAIGLSAMNAILVYPKSAYLLTFLCLTFLCLTFLCLTFLYSSIKLCRGRFLSTRDKTTAVQQ